MPQAYPGKRIVLDVYRVRAFSGKPRGLEKQALAWAPPEKLATYPMPPADRPVVAALMQPALYLVSPDVDAGAPAFLAGVDAALVGGLRRLQLRLPGASPSQRRDVAIAVLARCERHHAQLLINGDIDLATELGCGLHLRADQLMALDARPLRSDRLVAASCHDAAELARAEALGLDFVVLGPVAATASHPGQAPMGWRRFAELRETVSLPIYAIGGLARGDVPMARRCGAQGIAAISGLWPAAT